MPDKELTLEEVRSMAAEIGMTGLSDENLQMLLRATNAARARRTVLSTGDLKPTDEPSHVFTLEPRGGL
jgi:hypothetical protein